MAIEERLLRLENAFITLVELQRGLEERFDTHETWINQLGSEQVRLTQAQTQLAEAQTQLAEAQMQLAEAQTRLTEAQARTEAAVAETNERLNNLINVVERFISEGRNGKA